jgi:hypothetical protein
MRRVVSVGIISVVLSSIAWSSDDVVAKAAGPARRAKSLMDRYYETYKALNDLKNGRPGGVPAAPSNAAPTPAPAAQKPAPAPVTITIRLPNGVTIMFRRSPRPVSCATH